MRYSQSFAALAFVLVLPSCMAMVGIDDANLGEAVDRNIAIQTVNPNAPADSSPIDTEGQRAALAQMRYVTDRVETPADVSSSSSSSGGSSGASGAAASTGSSGASPAGAAR